MKLFSCCFSVAAAGCMRRRKVYILICSSLLLYTYDNLVLRTMAKRRRRENIVLFVTVRSLLMAKPSNVQEQNNPSIHQPGRVRAKEIWNVVRKLTFCILQPLSFVCCPRLCFSSNLRCNHPFYTFGKENCLNFI